MMKKSLFFLSIFLLLLTSCSGKQKIEGDWYTDYMDIYHFSDGKILCEDHSFTLENGEKISGVYTIEEDGVNIYVPSEGIERDSKLYILSIDGKAVISDKLDGSGKIYFYRDKNMTERALKKREEEDKKYLEQQKTTTENNTESFDDMKSDADYSEKLSRIQIRFVMDSIEGTKQLVKVYTKNTSEQLFSGDIYVVFYSSDKKQLGSDTIMVEKLMPGQESWSNVTIDKYNDTPKLETNFSNVSFSDLPKKSVVVDHEATEKTKDSVRLNFDVADWYYNIKSITVYDDGVCEVLSTSSDDNTVIASSVWSCGHEYGVKSVRVLDDSGKILATFN